MLQLQILLLLNLCHIFSLQLEFLNPFNNLHSMQSDIYSEIIDQILIPYVIQ